MQDGMMCVCVCVWEEIENGVKKKGEGQIGTRLIFMAYVLSDSTDSKAFFDFSSTFFSFPLFLGSLSYQTGHYVLITMKMEID